MNSIKKSYSYFDFSDLLYHYYISKISSKNYQKLLEEVFQHIVANNDQATNFWNNKASLILCLEILERQGIIETEIGKSLQNFNRQLVVQFSRQNSVNTVEDLPFFTILILYRLSHKGNYLNEEKVLFIQLTENLIQDLTLKKECLLKNTIQFHISALIKLCSFNTTYKKIILEELKHIYDLINVAFQAQTEGKLVYLNNLMIYPSLCQLLELENRIDLKSSLSSFFSNNKYLLDNSNWLDRFFFVNALISYNANACIKYFDTDIKHMLRMEAKRISFIANSSTDFESRLFALTKYSFDNKNDRNVMFEFFLIPTF